MHTTLSLYTPQTRILCKNLIHIQFTKSGKYVLGFFTNCNIADSINKVLYKNLIHIWFTRSAKYVLGFLLIIVLQNNSKLLCSQLCSWFEICSNAYVAGIKSWKTKLLLSKSETWCAAHRTIGNSYITVKSTVETSMMQGIIIALLQSYLNVVSCK